MHGKISSIFHDQRSIYTNLPNPFHATRYHSLIVDRASLPDCLEAAAWTDKGEIMGLRHREYDVEGVQFHPESILTEVGDQIIGNFINSDSRQKGSSRDGLRIKGDLSTAFKFKDLGKTIQKEGLNNDKKCHS
jgi:hypothetical protein